MQPEEDMGCDGLKIGPPLTGFPDNAMINKSGNKDKSLRSVTFCNRDHQK